MTFVLNLEVDEVTVLVSHGTDTIMIKPKNIPTPYPELKYDALVKIDARKGYGKEFCLKAGIPEELIKEIRV